MLRINVKAQLADNKPIYSSHLKLLLLNMFIFQNQQIVPAGSLTIEIFDEDKLIATEVIEFDDYDLENELINDEENEEGEKEPGTLH